MSTVFELVLGVFREPGLVADLRDKQLPDDLAQVIRLAAGEDAALRGAMQATGEVGETLVEASVFFLQQVLFAPGVDSYRVLGAAADSPQDRLRENYRWLMKWLHPDRNQDGWEAVYADRVNVAWQDLKTPERRADYDRRIPSASASSPAVMSASLVRRVAPVNHVPAGPLLSGSTVRRLPTLVLGALGAIAAATIGIMYWAQTETTRELAERQRDRNETNAGDPPRPGSASVEFVREAAPDPRMVAAANPDPTPALSDAARALPEPAVREAISEPIPDLAPAPLAVVESAQLASTVNPMPVGSLESMSVDAIAIPVAAPDVEVDPDTDVVAAAPPVRVIEVPATAARSPRTLPAAPPTKAPAAIASSAAVSDHSLQHLSGSTGIPSDLPPVRDATPDPPAVREPAPVVAAALAVGATSTRADAVEPQPALPGEIAAQSPMAVASIDEPVPAPRATISPPQLAPAQSDAEALVREFASAYASGDLARFDRLLLGARNNAAALDPMRSRFMSTEMRYLEIQQLRWHREAEQGHVRARFRDTYVPRGGRKAVTESGEIEWIIRLDAGDARIASVARNDARP